MKVSELIKALQAMDPDLEVYGQSDHGQTPEKVCLPSVVYVEAGTHTLYEGYTTCEDDAEEYGYTVKAVLL